MAATHSGGGPNLFDGLHDGNETLLPLACLLLPLARQETFNFLVKLFFRPFSGRHFSGL